MPTETPRPAPEDLVAAYEMFAHIAVDLFNTKGKVAPQFFALVLDEDTPGVIDQVLAVDPRLVASLYQNAAQKDLIKHLLNLLLDDNAPARAKLIESGSGAPSLVVQISEAWVLSAPADSDESEMPRPSQSLDRTEAVIVVVHSAKTSAMGMCPIHDGPTRQCEYRPLDIGPGTELYGNMSRQPMPSQDPSVTKH